MPSLSAGDNQWAYASEIEGVRPGYQCLITCHLGADFFNPVEYTEDRMHDTDFNPDLLTVEGPSTG